MALTQLKGLVELDREDRQTYLFWLHLALLGRRTNLAAQSLGEQRVVDGSGNQSEQEILLMSDSRMTFPEEPYFGGNAIGLFLLMLLFDLICGGITVFYRLWIFIFYRHATGEQNDE